MTNYKQPHKPMTTIEDIIAGFKKLSPSYTGIQTMWLTQAFKSNSA